MITLITGAPGAGKTSALVSLLRELAKGRAIFVDGIPDLKVEHAPLEDARQWPELVPDGAAVVIDEVQRVWRPAGAGQRIPPDIAALETHRHKGLDFFIVTQHPKLVHSNVRSLVGRHVHLRDVGVLGRWWYEWAETCPNPESGYRTAPVKKRYRLDKKAFALYKSASEHIKPIRSIPPSVLLLGAALVALAVLSYMVYRVIASKTEKPAVTAPAAAPGAQPGAAPAPVVRDGVQAITAHQLAMSFVPRQPNRPETAPAYDHLRQVRSMPMVVAGFCYVGGDCRCFTRQGTKAQVTDDACRQWVAEPPFDPYRAPDGPVGSSPPPQAQKAPQAPPDASHAAL